MVNFLIEINAISERKFEQGRIEIDGFVYQKINIKYKKYNFELTYNAKETNGLYDKEDYLIFFIGDVYYRNGKRISPLMLTSKLNNIAAFDYNEIKGLFTIVIFNKRKDTLSIVSSKNAMYDTYYFDDSEQIVFSSSILDIQNVVKNKIKISESSIINKAIFSHTLGDNTFYKNVKLLTPSSVLKYDDKLSILEYFNYKKMISYKSEMSWVDLHKEIPKLFNKIMDSLTSERDNFLCSLTGGFDSRTNASYFLKNNTKNVHYYSWAANNKNVDVYIPEIIKKKFKINYQPIILEKEFIKNYSTYATNAILSTDGRASVRRANHYFAYSQLAKKSNYNITGIVGSELLRYITDSVGGMYGDRMVSLLLAKDTERKAEQIWSDFNSSDCWKLELGQCAYSKDQFINGCNEFMNEFKDITKLHHRIKYFQLRYGFRKYFGQEIHGMRYFVKTVSPYLDDDFIDFILRSPIDEINEKSTKNKFKQDFKYVKMGQSIYYPIIKQNEKKLLDIITTRFYTPNQLMSKVSFIRLIGPLLKKGMRKKQQEKYAFNSRTLFEEKMLPKDQDCIKNNILQLNTSKYTLDQFYDFANIFSIIKWMEISNKQEVANES